MDNTVIIRPPSEASSLLLPVTIGCSHNKCTFCHTYNDYTFGVRNIEDIIRDIDTVAGSYSRGVSRVFLENGDALIAPQPVLLEVLQYLKQKFPNLERVGTYATPKSALVKSVDELRELHELGMQLVYLGVESGDEEVLKKVDKGATRDQIVEAGRKLKQAGITVSATVILGLAGVEGSEKHAVSTGKILTDIDPDFAGALTLMLVPGSPLYNDWKAGRFTLISPLQSLVELKLIIENSNFTNCFFTSNHASNYLPIRARLPERKTELLEMIEDVLSSGDNSQLRPEFLRAL
ncbi:B12-binding domain-containing radical SAM protein [Chloroflexota bacterium]